MCRTILHMANRKRKVLLKAWNQVALRSQMTLVRRQTADIFHRKQYTLKCYHALASFSRYSIRSKFNDLKSSRANMRRLATIGF